MLWIALIGWTALAESPAPVLAFETDIRPILRIYCLDCHGGEEKLQGGLDLRQARLARKGGKHGPVLAAGKPALSPLLERMKSGEMPPGEKKVPAAQIALIEQWISQGAKTLRPEPETIDPGLSITPEDRAYWFYQPIRRLPPPALGAATPIDAWVLAGLRQRGLGFVPEADRRTLIRRVALDLTGLPPTRLEIAAFLADSGAKAYENMVDRYLAAPGYAERWARHWLDVFGYADSDGDGTNDTVRPYAWKFRDYLIRALEADKPLDRLFLEMLAGDELLPRPLKDPQQPELLAATLLARLGPDATASGGEQPLVADLVMADSLKIISASLLGLTVGCAQCHDHKYDPIPQADYFRLRAIFAPAWNPAAWKGPGGRVVSLMTTAQREERARLEVLEKDLVASRDKKANEWIATVFAAEIARFPEPERQPLIDAFKAPADKRTPTQKKLVEGNPKLNISAGVLYQFNQKAVEELKKIDDELGKVRARKPVEDFVSCLAEDPGLVVDTRLHHRGDPRQPKGPALAPADLTIAQPEGKRADLPAKNTAMATTGRRLAWVKTLFRGDHPLVGRVLANRLWLHHFGRGIVDTPGDFGLLGQPPTHPALLDHLADELARAGWSQKALHRQILRSATYRQTSRATPEALAKDPDNRLYSRYPAHRLESEAIRDRVLATSGALDATRFGPPVVTEEDASGLVNAQSKRRSIYLQVRRSRPETLMAAFDTPSPALNCDKRVRSNAATQALVLMNGEFLRGQAATLAARARAEAGANPQAMLAAKPFATRQILPAPVWTYGFGALDPAGKPAGFTPLPHWTGSQFQGSARLPDPATGWVLLNAAGGHPGDPAHAAIRRFVAPADGTLQVTGTLNHSSPLGNGVRARLIVPGPRPDERLQAGEWTVRNSTAATNAGNRRLRKGEIVDCVVDCLGQESSDSFGWAVVFTLSPTDGKPASRYDSASAFAGPTPPTGPPLAAQAAHALELAQARPAQEGELELLVAFLENQAARLRGLPALEQAIMTNLCQQLLSTNEFLYVD